MTPKTGAYDLHRERARARQASASRSGRDIGDLPPPEDPDRRRAALDSLLTFFEIYFPHTFYLPWSQAHIDSIADIQRTIRRSELLCEAMPRGWGKTSRFERAALWAGLNNYSRFCVIVGASEGASKEVLDTVKMELETNELLAADFPEVCLPIRALDRITNRARGQTYHGQPTYITWQEDRIILPTIRGAAGSGFIVRVAGLTGRIRGMKQVRPDGRNVRPDLALIDDPQTDESAESPAQVQKRHRLVNGAVMRLAGPDQKVAVMASVTVIKPDDLADRLIDRKASPQWHGRRYRTVESFPRVGGKSNGTGKFEPAWWDLWQEYASVRARGMNREDGGKAARRFYRKHQADLEDGVKVNWIHKIETGDLTAIQSALNWLIDDPESFWAEGQNEPKPPEATVAAFDAEGLSARILKIPRGTVPAGASILTAFVDVQKPYLPWMIVAWSEGFAGHVVDYGTWPEQTGEPYFQRRSAKHTIAKQARGKSRPEQLYGALSTLSSQLLGRAYPIESQVARADAELSIDLVLVDAGYDTDTVVQFCRELKNPRVMPSRGDGLRPSDTPITERKPKEGQRLGHHWMIHVPQKRAIRHVFFDTNRWKSITSEGLTVELGAPNALTFFHANRRTHRVLLDQLTAEYPETTEARGRSLDLWYLRPNRENDLWDCLVGNAAAASVRGLKGIGHQTTKAKSSRRRRARGAWAGTRGSRR